MSDQPPARPPKPPLTDSPLFWLCLFGVVALAALIVVGPRYARRQGQLQQRLEARERIARQAAERTGAVKASDADAAPPAARQPSLRPLFLAIAGLVAIVAIGLLVRRLRT